MPTLRKLTAPLFGAALLLAAAPGPASEIDVYVLGNELLKFCKGTGAGEAGYDVASHNTCAGYLAGIADAEEAWWKHKAKAFCIPKGTRTGQHRQVFLHYMDQHPEDWHAAAASLAINAFIGAWPCAH